VWRAQTTVWTFDLCNRVLLGSGRL